MARPRLASLALLIAAVAVLGLAGVRYFQLQRRLAPAGDTATSRTTDSEQCGLGVPPELAARCRAALVESHEVERQRVLLYTGFGLLLLCSAAVTGFRKAQS